VIVKKLSGEAAMTHVSLSNVPAWILFLMVVCGSMVLASGGLLLVRHWMKKPEDEEHNILVTGMFATVSLVYTVLLAFLIISVWETFNAANQAVSEEAAALITVARDAELLPEPLRSEVLNELHIYTRYVMDDEWDTMRQGVNQRQIASQNALTASADLWIMYRKIPPSTMNAEMLRSLDTLSEQRVVRLMASQDSLPGIFWFVLVLGAIITISFSFLLRVADIRLHVAMVLLLTCSITLCLWLIILMNNPFVGNMQVSAEPLKYALYVIDSLPR
jgi:uncharacterized protein DUF4239